MIFYQLQSNIQPNNDNIPQKFVHSILTHYNPCLIPSLAPQICQIIPFTKDTFSLKYLYDHRLSEDPIVAIYQVFDILHVIYHQRI